MELYHGEERVKKELKSPKWLYDEERKVGRRGGRGHLFGLVSKKYSRLLPGGRLARKWTRLWDKFVIGRVTAIRGVENKISISLLP